MTWTNMAASGTKLAVFINDVISSAIFHVQIQPSATTLCAVPLKVIMAAVFTVVKKKTT